jgi:thioredoxin-like negative regulator of GroEL
LKHILIFSIGLNKRVESIVVVLEGSSVDKFKGTVMEKALQNLLQTLNESVNFVKKFTDVSTLNRFFNNTDHQLQFQMLNMQLLQNTNDLNLALNINSVFDQQQDMIDRQDDLADIFSKLDDIALAMVKQQEELRHQKKYMEKEFLKKI